MGRLKVKDRINSIFTECFDQILKLLDALLRELTQATKLDHRLHRTTFPNGRLQFAVLVTQFDPRLFHFPKRCLLLLIQQQQKLLPCFVEFGVGLGVFLLRAKVHVVLILLHFAGILRILCKNPGSQE